MSDGLGMVTHMANRRISFLGSCAVVALCAGGCMAPSETSPRIGGEVALEAIEPLAEPEPPLTKEPSLTSIDRSEWEEVVFLVPVDNRYLFPGASLRPDYTDALVRQREEFPTAESVVALNGPAFPQQLESVAAPIWAAWDFVSLPRALFGYVPHRDGRPLDWRDRAPESGLEQPISPLDPVDEQ